MTRRRRGASTCDEPSRGKEGAARTAPARKLDKTTELHGGGCCSARKKDKQAVRLVQWQLRIWEGGAAIELQLEVECYLVKEIDGVELQGMDASIRIVEHLVAVNWCWI